MFKVLVWDYVGISEQWMQRFADMKDIEIVATITPHAPTPEILLKTDAWDWLLIFEQGARNFFGAMIQVLKLPPDKVIYALDINSWKQHPKAVYTLINDAGGGIIRREFLMSELKIWNTFATCTVEGLSYIATSADPFRMPDMFANRINYASDNMKRFHALAKQFYNVDDSAGYFLDLGANIGTSGLYFIKKLTPNLKLLAFEPDPENFKMHRLNIILNDLDNVTTLINCGLGNEASELMFYSNGDNPGARGFIKHEKSAPIATVKVIPLDSYLSENKIAAQDVKYIWIDTEGFEAQVLLGAKNLLKENPAPIFMECNLRAWDNSGYFDDMMALLSEGYSHFVHFYHGEKLYPLDALMKMERLNSTLGQVGDIFLIKRGVIA